MPPITLPYIVRKKRKVEVERSAAMAPVSRALHSCFEYWLISDKYDRYKHTNEVVSSEFC